LVNSGRVDSSIYEIDRDSLMVFCQYDFDSRTMEAPVLAALPRDLIVSTSTVGIIPILMALYGLM
jgi:hypothetical protein